MRFLSVCCLLLAVLWVSGCAAVFRGSTQQVHVNAYDAKTNDATPADCFLSNDEGIVYTRSNRSVIVGRDKDPMDFFCHTDTLAGKTKVEGSINVGFVAVDFFIIDACLVSCFVDGLSGAWAEYPSMLDLALSPKDENYYLLVREKSKMVKEKLTQLKKNYEPFSKALSNKDDPNYYIAEAQRKEIDSYELLLVKLESGLPAKQEQSKGVTHSRDRDG